MNKQLKQFILKEDKIMKIDLTPLETQKVYCCILAAISEDEKKEITENNNELQAKIKFYRGLAEKFKEA